MNNQREDLDYDYGGAMQEAWEGGVGDVPLANSEGKPMQYEPDGTPILEPYVFGTSHRSRTLPRLTPFRSEQQVLGPLHFTKLASQRCKSSVGTKWLTF